MLELILCHMLGFHRYKKLFSFQRETDDKAMASAIFCCISCKRITTRSIEMQKYKGANNDKQ